MNEKTVLGVVSGAAPENLKQVYLNLKSEWKTEFGHPWEMIEFYRAVLLMEPAEKLERLNNAYSLAQGHDATLHVISAVILGSILLQDSSRLEEYNKLLQLCSDELPALGSRIDILREQPQKKRMPMELAQLVLPFNFR